MKKNFHNDVTPPHSNLKRKRCKTDLESTFAYKVEHELQARNILPASDLVRGWIIDSGASAHMTPFKQDCNNIQPTYKQIFLADGSSVLCKEMGQVNIPIKHGRRDFGTLVLEDVLIVPNLDRRLFSVNSFLARGNNWVHFENQHIELGIQDGPKIKIPLSSLQTNAMIVNTRRNKYSDESIPTPTTDQTKDMVKINMNKIHERFHRSEGAIATIRAHNLWNDVEITDGIDHICTSCKTMTIPAASRGKSRSSIITSPLEEIQVDTVPNPEPIGLNSESKYNYFLILCDRFSRVFRLIGIRDKSSEACIDGIEQLTANFPNLLSKNKIKEISHIRSDAGSEFRSDTFRKWCGENNIRFNTAAPKHQEQNGLVERHWGTIVKMANTLLIHARLSTKFLYYAIKYAQYIHDVIPVKELYDANGMPTTPHYLATGRKPQVKHFRVFGCPAVFKKYEYNNQGKGSQISIFNKV